jgi:hypothetical protein
MRVRSAAPFVVAAILAGGVHAPAEAATKKPVSKEYDLTLTPMPDARTTSACSSDLLTAGQNMDEHSLKVSGPGKLTVTVTGFSGDWDIAIMSSSGVGLTEGDGTVTPTSFSTPAGPIDEVAKYKAKMAMSLVIRVCNFLGTPTAHVKYTFVYS